MGLIQEERRQGLYMKISNGQISYTVAKGTEGAEEVEYEDSRTKEKKVTYKMRVPSLLGTFTGAAYKDTPYGEVLEVYIQNGIEEAILQLKVDSSIHNAFVNLLMNVDVAKQVRLSAWLYNDRTYIGMEQNGIKVLPKNTKDNSEAPAPEKVMKRGKEVWNWEPVLDYYYNYIINVFTKKFDNIKPEPQPEQQPKQQTDNSNPFAQAIPFTKTPEGNFDGKAKNPEDDLPF